MTNEEYIQAHREEDVRRLALGRIPKGVDMKWCLQQIEGWQIARQKLPTWAQTEGLWYPPRLSMEQCSSELTARYKRAVAERLIPEEGRIRMVDLTGGLGVDFSYLASLFHEATYVEILPELRKLAQHNMPLLGLPHATIVEPNNPSLFIPHSSLIYVDPARRDEVGRKTISIADCTPDVTALQDRLFARARYIMVKLSPMLDITEALRQLRHVSEVHAVSVRGECKELLFVMQRSESISIHCVNLGTDEDVLMSPLGAPLQASFHYGEVQEGQFLYEPNASILKAGIQDLLCECYGVRKLHPVSNLFVGDALHSHFPGRRFRITAMSDFSKKGLKAMIGDLSKANLTVRNFPTPVARLRQQLRLAEGGDVYLFATTLHDGQHALIRCAKS